MSLDKATRVNRELQAIADDIRARAEIDAASARLAAGAALSRQRLAEANAIRQIRATTDIIAAEAQIAATAQRLRAGAALSRSRGRRDGP